MNLLRYPIPKIPRIPLAYVRLLTRQSSSLETSAKPKFDKLQSDIEYLYSRLLRSEKEQTHIEFFNEPAIVTKLQDIINQNGFNKQVDEIDWFTRKDIMTTIPEPPDNLTKQALNDYVISLTDVDAKRYPEVQPYIEKIFYTLASPPTAADMSMNSYNRIIAYFAKQYRISDCYSIRNLSIEGNRKPTIESANILINLICKTSFKIINKQSQLMTNLQFMEEHGLKPNITTLFTLYKGFNDVESQEEILKILTDNQVKIFGIIREITRNKLNNRESIESILNFFDKNSTIRPSSPPITFEIASYYLDKLDDPQKAWDYIMKASKDRMGIPGFRVIRKFYFYFANKNQFYNCIALLNYLQATNRLEEGTNDFGVLLRVLSLLPFNEPFEHWELVSRRLYQLALMRYGKPTETKQKDEEEEQYFFSEFDRDRMALFTYEEIEAINERGRSINPDFDVSAPFESYFESHLVNAILKRLNWVLTDENGEMIGEDDGPNFELANNAEEFQKAAKLLICPRENGYY